MRIPKKIMLILMLASLAVAGYFVLQEKKQDAAVSPDVYTEELIIEKQSGGTHTFNVEIADTPIDIQIGLMHRTSMPKDHGMLFVYSKPTETRFWMKNTKISLDMLFVDEDGVITKIHPRATPESLQGIPSEGKVLGVIEINGGRAEELGIKVGDRVDHDIFRKQPAGE